MITAQRLRWERAFYKPYRATLTYPFAYRKACLPAGKALDLTRRQ